MLFDHGSDIFNGFMCVLQFIKIFRIFDVVGILTIFLPMMTLYFIAMWVQYGSGYFVLGKINPVD